MSRYLGIDLAWGEGTDARPAKETGLVLLDEYGTILEAGWARGINDVLEWIEANALPGDVIGIDAPLVVTNETGMRECEREVAQRYGPWKVYANPSNLSREWFGGITLRVRLEALGYLYTDGTTPVDASDISFFECYPYTTLVGVEHLGYDYQRPRYKRFNLALPLEERRPFRMSECDELIRRLAQLDSYDPPLDLASHPLTSALITEPSPSKDIAYKHREDLLDAAICAWTAAIWTRHGLERSQLLGADDAPDLHGRRPVIIAPTRPEQRKDARAKKSLRRAPAPDPQSTTELLVLAEAVLASVAVGPSDDTDYGTARDSLLVALGNLDQRQERLAGEKGLTAE